MTRRTNAGKSRHASLLVLLLCVLVVLAACGSDTGSTNNDRGRFSEIPTIVIDDAPDATPTPEADSEPPAPEFVERILDPGPTLEAPQRIFFRNDRDLWVIEGDEARPVLPQGTRFGAYATSTHGQRAAVVIISDVDSQPAESVHIIANDTLGPPLTPPRFTSGPDAQTSIQSLVWSRDATRVAIVYDEPVVALLEIARPDNAPPEIVQEIHLPDEYRRIKRVDFSTTGHGISILAETPAGVGSLWVASMDGELFEVRAASLDGQRSIADAAWLPGRGRIAFVEERIEHSPAIGGSMFTIAPDGSGRELLVSSGNFAPAAEIVKLVASPGGAYVAFTVNVPDRQGDDRFHSAWIVNIDSGIIAQAPITAGYRVTDLWWTVDGLLWRAVHQSAEAVDSISSYAGFEPFIVGRFVPDPGSSQVLFQSAGS